ncbi:hypothetical protein OIU79_013117 [Salix purpurea]|uniref:Uncharacterized protein n=1 Tax=Salix purpurea TaxID=77065 RepID=A0A9Q0T450_SALPP|nr:hypothetical protein OIU79_013117 [Salix purpurea]
MGLFELVLLISFDGLQLGLEVACGGVGEVDEEENGIVEVAGGGEEEVSSGKKTRRNPMPQFSLLFLPLLDFAMIPISLPSYLISPLSSCGFDEATILPHKLFSLSLAINYSVFYGQTCKVPLGLNFNHLFY